ncbi:hypothetical protein NE237_000630 [Protea cynaroides]|uniref:Pectate lyase n=1 Tax=Protea cynaroides TaxID=273540 RepID=A0A9Q0QXN8_9MAGN|nr:hypothetical protein NE237_000630 [Protea cynaroides]
MASATYSFLLWCLLAVCLVSTSQASYGYGPVKKAMNSIDGCWRWNSNWAAKRRSLAYCATGFGEGAIGGRYGRMYVVTSPADDPINPQPGTLRYGVIQPQPLWIKFARDMVIKLENGLIMNSYKTIDGRGAKVEIAYGPCITVQGVSHIIIHGINFHDCQPGKSGMVRSSTTHLGHRQGSPGDAIQVFASSNVWIDHCSFAQSADTHIDIIHASTAITVSNCYFTQQDEVMLLGHNDGYTADKIMKVTVAYNFFGPGCNHRMPRVRFGYAHIVNNRYDQWQMYAIGGSADPTIFSQGNYYLAANSKEVTKRMSGGRWDNWKWRSSGDLFLNGAYFVQSGYGSCSPEYAHYEWVTAAPAFMVPALTAQAGPLNCNRGKLC